MGGVFSLFLILLGLAAIFIGIVSPKETKDRYGDMVLSKKPSIWKSTGVVIVGVGLVTLTFLSLTSVDQGEVHVPVQFGKVLDPITTKGLQMKSPFATIVVMPIRTVEVTFEGQGDVEDSESSRNLREISALTAEGAQVAVDMTVLYHVDPTMTAQVYATVGTQWESVLVLTRARNTARDCLPKFTFEEGRTVRRGEAQNCILEAMQAALGPRGLVIEDVLLRDMRADAQLQKAIDAKLEAQSNAQRAEFIQREAEITAETKRIEAAGLANARIEQARGDALAIIEVAKAEALANDLIAASLTPELLQLRIFEQLGDKAVIITNGEGLPVLPILPLD